MHNLGVLLKKEWQESTRDLRVLWLPIVFIAASIAQPIAMQFLPEILKNSARSGITIDPAALKQTGDQIFANIFNQVDQFVVMIIPLVLMGTIAKEKQDGTLDVLFSKPVTTQSYLASKLILNILVMVLSVLIGILAGWYYTNVYYSNVTAEGAVKALLVYTVWLAFVTVLSVSASAICRKPAQAAVLTIGLLMVMMLVSGFATKTLNWFLPSSISAQAASLVAGAKWSHDLTLTLLITGLEMLALIFVSYSSLRVQRR
jgi:ABC-2 type transport system permease protein